MFIEPFQRGILNFELNLNWHEVSPLFLAFFDRVLLLIYSLNKKCLRITFSVNINIIYYVNHSRVGSGRSYEVQVGVRKIKRRLNTTVGRDRETLRSEANG